MIRGHTDAAPWSARSGTNNWRLSVERAEVSWQYLAFRGIAASRFSRIEGVADREPYVPSNRLDPRNRRISVTRSEEHTSELQSLMRISYAVFCLKKKIKNETTAKTE